MAADQDFPLSPASRSISRSSSSGMRIPLDFVDNITPYNKLHNVKYCAHCSTGRVNLPPKVDSPFLALLRKDSDLPLYSTKNVLETGISGIGQIARDVELARQQEGSVLDALQDRRDEASGVSIDEEVTNLIRLQAAFQANARIITTVNQLLDSILQIV